VRTSGSHRQQSWRRASAADDSRGEQSGAGNCEPIRLAGLESRRQPRGLTGLKSRRQTSGIAWR
jgi:hypothetical protein